jgi:V8-like Glu-specific endopeptidase
MKHKNLKKILGVFTALMLMLVSMLSTYNVNTAKASNASITYEVWNAKTWRHDSDRDYTLEQVTSFPITSNSSKIIGSDSRYEDYKAGVAKFVTTGGSSFTGFVVGSHTIATAAHAVCQTTLESIYLFDEDGNRIKLNPVETHIPKTYRQLYYKCNGRGIGDNEEASKLDYALVTVEEDVSDYKLFNLATVTDGFDNKTSGIYITGFPKLVNTTDTVNTRNLDGMYTGYGYSLKGTLTENYIYTRTDASEGDSGAPAYIREVYSGNVYYSIIGICISGDSKGTETDGTYTRLLRLSTDTLHFFINNSNIQY